MVYGNRHTCNGSKLSNTLPEIGHEKLEKLIILCLQLCSIFEQTEPASSLHFFSVTAAKNPRYWRDPHCTQPSQNCPHIESTSTCLAIGRYCLTVDLSPPIWEPWDILSLL